MNITLTLIQLFLSITFVGFAVDGLECYLCGDDGEVSCIDFEIAKIKYAKECHPNENQGCLKKTEGKKITRSCTEKKLNDCKVANDVEYCFCFTNLCNDNIGGKFLTPTDDEDLLEGSGTKTVTTVVEKTNFGEKTQSAAVEMELSNILYFILVFAVYKL